MTNSFWFSQTTGEDPIKVPAVEPPYDIEESARFDGQGNKLTRTPSNTDGQRKGETGAITNVAVNTDNSQTLTVKDGFEPHQSLTGEYLQVGDVITQDSVGFISTSEISSVSSGYTIDNSVIFDGSSSSLTRTPSVAGNRKTWTYSVWLKRSKLGDYGSILGTTSNNVGLRFDPSTNKLEIFEYSGSAYIWQLMTDQVFRDVSGWMHLVFAWDTTQATASDRAKLFINGERVTNFSTANYPSQDYEGPINGSGTQAISDDGASHDSYFNGYLADIQFVDGRALDASYFGEYNSDGVWIPKTADLTVLSPYETRPNADQNWSALATLESGSSWNSSYPLENMFDGDLDTEGGLTFAAGQSGTLNFTGLGTISKLRLYAALSGQNGSGVIAGSIIVNGIDITAGGNNSIWAQSGGINDKGWVELPLDQLGNQLNSIQLTVSVGTANTPYINAIEVDNHILVDGPWNDSQVWSDSWNTTQIDNPTNAFDGSDTTYTHSSINNPQDIGFVFETPFNTSVTGGDVEILAAADASMTLWFGKNGEVTSSNPDDGVLVSVTTTPVTVTIPSAGSDISSIEFGQKSGIGTIRIHSVKVGGELLVDASAQWNTTQTWSTLLGGSTITNPSNGFNGETDGYADSSAGWSLDLSSTTFGPGEHTIEVRSGGATSITVNGTTSLTDPGGGGAKVWTGTHTGEINTIASSATNASVYFVKIDGVWLVDGGYGYNGFHLDFSSTNLGEDSGGAGNDWTANGLESVSGTFPGSISLTTYTGVGSNTQTVDGFGFSPDLIWIKNLTSAQDHCLYDTLRGVDRNQLNSNNTNQEAGNLSETGGVTSTTSDGFVLTNDNTINGGTNGAGNTFSAWCWDAGTSAPAAASGGSIATTNKNNGLFAINTWNTTAAVGTIDTGLPSADFVIIKTTNVTGDWYVWHKEFPNVGATNGSNLLLNDTRGWEGNSDVFQVGGATGGGLVSLGSLGNPNAAMVAYSWYESDGLSKFGSYAGTNSTQTIETGFAPALVIIKAIDAERGWITFSSDRSGKYVNLNSAGNETTTADLELLDNGFRVSGTDNSYNSSSKNYIYAAWSDEVVKISEKTIDSPVGFINTDGDAVGNYATLDPLQSALAGLTEGNLVTVPTSSSGWRICTATLSVSSGKWYWEGFTDTTSLENVGWNWGFCNVNPASLTDAYGTGKWSYQDAVVYEQSSTGTIIPTTAVANDILAYALDMDAGTCDLYVNNVLVYTFREITGRITPFVGSYATASMTVNFGQKPFTYTPPAGYKSLCETNL